MNNQPIPMFTRLSEDGRVDVLMLVLLLSGVGLAGLTHQSGQLFIAIAGWLLAVIALAVLGIIELGAAMTELRRHPESFESADRTAFLWWYLVNTRHGTIGFIGLCLIAAGILGEAIQVPDSLQLLVLVLGGVVAALGAYHPLLVPDEEEFFEEDSASE